MRDVADGQTGLCGHRSGHTPLLLRHHGHDSVGDLAAHGAVELPAAEGDGLCVRLVLSTHKATTEAESQTVPQVSNTGVSKAVNSSPQSSLQALQDWVPPSLPSTQAV